jgi:hypothetical protein
MGSAFGDASGFSEAAAVRLAPTGDLRRDADCVQWLVIFIVIVAAIGRHG